MKRFIQRLQKLLAIDRVLNNHPVLFDEKPEAQAVKNDFTALIVKITKLVSQLAQPISNVYRPKMQGEKNLRTQLRRMAGIGILVARRILNEVLLNQMINYKGLASRASAYTMCEYSLFVATELQKYQDLAIELGLSDDELSAFNVAATDFNKLLRDTGFELSDRKTKWKELKTLFSKCSQMLQKEIDELVFYWKDFDPDLYREYMTLRRAKSRKSSSSSDESTLAEITGTVTASDTGEPVEGVTVEIAELGISTETDEDGYFHLDEIPASHVSINCHMTGFITPAPKLVNAEANASLMVDFSITPAESSQVSPAT